MAGKLEKQIKKKKEFSSPQQAVVLGILRANDLFQYRFAQLFREFGLTQPQYNVLRILRGEGTPLPCLEIANRMIAIVPAITGLIDKLEKKELVKRNRCKVDRRVWYVSLTTSGKRLLSKMDEPVMELYEQLCKGLSKQNCQHLIELLERARDSAESSVDAN